MKIDMMEKHPLSSQAFIPIKETTFLCFVAPQGESPEINKIQSFIIQYVIYCLLQEKRIVFIIITKKQ